MLLLQWLAVLAGTLRQASCLGDELVQADFSQKGCSLPGNIPSASDSVGRDMLVRTVKGASISISGTVASSVSAVIALIVGVAAVPLPQSWIISMNWLIDLVMGIPHTVLLISSFACGRA